MNGLAVGDRVVAASALNCGKCDACARGKPVRGTLARWGLQGGKRRACPGAATRARALLMYAVIVCCNRLSLRTSVRHARVWPPQGRLCACRLAGPSARVCRAPVCLVRRRRTCRSLAHSPPPLGRPPPTHSFQPRRPPGRRSAALITARVSQIFPLNPSTNTVKTAVSTQIL